MKRKTQSDVATGDDNDSSTSNKRPRDGENGDDDGGATTTKTAAPAAPADQHNKPTPQYGTKEYWEARYKSHLPGVNVTPENQQDCDGGGGVASSSPDGNSTKDSDYMLDGVVLSKEAIKPGHEWYFNYDELRPLILPLILGEGDNEIDQDEYNEDDEGEWVEEGEDEEGEWVEEGEENNDGGGNEDEDGNDEEGEAAGEGEDEGEADAENGQSTSEEKVTSHQDGITAEQTKTDRGADDGAEEEITEQTDPSNMTVERPKKVLEVGCGDVPLGSSLVSDLTSMQSATGHGATEIVSEVLCIDYSEIVVEKLEKEQAEKEKAAIAKEDKDGQEQLHEKLQTSFQAMDARSFPKEWDNTYDLILEKGTLDAMLSDEEEGISNCIKIVKEMARVTSEGGAILIVSHLNASESKGMGWLEDVVFRGLKDEFMERQLLKREERKEAKKKRQNQELDSSGEDDDEKEFIWSVEVHGGEGKFLDANGEEIEPDKVDPERDVPIYGPAVYILRKKGVPASIARALFGRKKTKEGEGDDEEEKGGGQNGDVDDEEDDDVMEMPPVKLEFLTYD